MPRASDPALTVCRPTAAGLNCGSLRPPRLPRRFHAVTHSLFGRLSRALHRCERLSCARTDEWHRKARPMVESGNARGFRAGLASGFTLSRLQERGGCGRPRHSRFGIRMRRAPSDGARNGRLYPGVGREPPRQPRSNRPVPFSRRQLRLSPYQPRNWFLRSGVCNEGKAAAVSRHPPSSPPNRVCLSIMSDGSIAIIGASCRFPGAPGLEAFWELLTLRHRRDLRGRCRGAGRPGSTIIPT